MNLNSINLAISAVGLVIGLLGEILSLSSMHVEARIRRYCIALFGVLVLYVASNLAGQISNNIPGWFLMTQTMIFIESASSSILLLFLNHLLLITSGREELDQSVSYHLSACIWAVYLGLLIFTQFTRIIYYVDETNTYHRGPFYPILLIPPILIALINLGTLFVRRKYLTRCHRIAFLVYFLAPMLAMVIQIFFYGVYVIVLGTAIASLLLFINIQNEQTEIYIRQQEENSRLKIDILLAQIQPHFLRNSLGVIQMICESDPRAAASAIRDFNHFLGYNMDSLSQEHPIPFSAEWEHTRSYISLQKLRFEDALEVRQDFQCTDFSLPTLTLQPLVENAISYGIRKNSGGMGTVSIATRDKGDHIEISVVDNGPGFTYDPDHLDSQGSHVGLRNVSERLRRVCGGELKIVSKEGCGTSVTMILPKVQGNNA